MWISESQFCAVTEGSKGVIYDSNTLQHIAAIRWLPESSAGISSSNVYIHHYEESCGFSYHHRKDLNQAPRQNPILYCFAGHKAGIGRLSSKAHIQTSSGSELKLDTGYFTDRQGVKLGKKDLQITAGLILPLRRILLLGTDDGSVRTVI